jgi:hypothetical protein
MKCVWTLDRSLCNSCLTKWMFYLLVLMDWPYTGFTVKHTHAVKFFNTQTKTNKLFWCILFYSILFYYIIFYSILFYSTVFLPITMKFPLQLPSAEIHTGPETVLVLIIPVSLTNDQPSSCVHPSYKRVHTPRYRSIDIKVSRGQILVEIMGIEKVP